MTEKMSRKQFFRRAFDAALQKGADALQRTGVVEKLEQWDKTKVKRQRPPGACHTEPEFLQKCTGCDACMAACPVHVILIEDLERRDPVIYPGNDPCIHCPGYPCVSACPTGALEHGNGTKLRLL